MDEQGNDVEYVCTASGLLDVPTAVASPEGPEAAESDFPLFGNDSNLPECVRNIVGLHDTHTRVISSVIVDPLYYAWD
jgi:hypothetical protein